MTRMAARNELSSLIDTLSELRGVLLGLAEEHVDTVMPGYTHLQPAQPTTLGHYLASVSLALERDADRLLEVHPRLNLNPLGACAFAGTGFPIDREMTARLLGFDGAVASTLDAVASRDYVPEILSALAATGVTLSRLAQDLYLWCSDEWATVEVADEVAITSSIMPQKKNPITLEHIKAGAAHLTGALVASLTVQKSVNFMHCMDMSHETVTPLWEAMAHAEGMIHLTRRTVSGLQVDGGLMARRAAEDFSTATELADSLVRDNDLPFRVAHGIVANVVSRGAGARPSLRPDRRRHGPQRRRRANGRARHRYGPAGKTGPGPRPQHPGQEGLGQPGPERDKTADRERQNSGGPPPQRRQGPARMPATGPYPARRGRVEAEIGVVVLGRCSRRCGQGVGAGSTRSVIETPDFSPVE